MPLDTHFVRSQFTQLTDQPDFVFACNAGGSYVCNQVNEIFEHYNRHTRVQPYSRFASSAAAGEAMDRAYAGWAEALNIAPHELTIGPSTSMNTYVLAQAVGASWQAGDEIVVTNQDHEANSGVWRRKAEERGVVVREWRADPQTGLLDLEQLIPLLSPRTRWVFFTHCSNIIGTANPVAQITAAIKSACSAKVFVDAVAYAPHHISDLKALGVDGYVFSLYKVFGPHQSIMYVDEAVHEHLTSQAHFFNVGLRGKDLNPAGPQHAQVAACAGVLDYLDTLHEHHFGSSDTSRPDRLEALHRLILEHENQLAEPLLATLRQRNDIQLLGKHNTADNDRAPTIAFRPLKQSAADLTRRMQEQNIGTEHGNFYAVRLVTDLGIDPDDGVVRLSLVHYNTQQDVAQIVTALETCLN